MKLFLIRHAQGGNIKENYDTLSDLGKKQSYNLAQYFNHQKINFDCFITGTLNRHKETLEILLENLNDYHHNIYNFSNLDEISEQKLKKILVYSLKNENEIKKLYKNFITFDSEIRTRYLRLFEKVLSIWIEKPYFNNSFHNYKNYVLNFIPILEDLYKKHSFKNVLVISSSTPIALLIGKILNYTDQESLELLKKIKNTSLSIFEIQSNLWKPIEINTLPHLKNHQITLL